MYILIDEIKIRIKLCPGADPSLPHAPKDLEAPLPALGPATGADRRVAHAALLRSAAQQLQRQGPRAAAHRRGVAHGVPREAQLQTALPVTGKSEGLQESVQGQHLERV